MLFLASEALQYSGPGTFSLQYHVLDLVKIAGALVMQQERAASSVSRPHSVQLRCASYVLGVLNGSEERTENIMICMSKAGVSSIDALRAAVQTELPVFSNGLLGGCPFHLGPVPSSLLPGMLVATFGSSDARRCDSNASNVNGTTFMPTLIVCFVIQG